MQAKPTIKTCLKRQTKVFITFRDLFCNTDAYVLDFLYKKIKSENCMPYLEKLVIVYENIPKESLCVIPYGKKHQNPILDFVDYKQIQKCDYVAVFDEMYDEILYNKKSNILENLQLTHTAKYLKPLLLDDLLESVTIQTDVLTDAIYTFIYDNFAKIEPNKVKIAEGHMRDTVLPKYDDYFLPSMYYVDMNLCVERSKQVDVMIPQLLTTLELDENRKPLQPKRLKLNKTPSEYRNKYKMNVLGMKIPI